MSLQCRLESESTTSSGTKIRSNYQNYDVDIGKFSTTPFNLYCLLISVYELDLPGPWEAPNGVKINYRGIFTSLTKNLIHV